MKKRAEKLGLRPFLGCIFKVIFRRINTFARSVPESIGKMMRKEYDFSRMKGRKNPFARRLKKQITIRLGQDIIDYFQSLAKENGIPYQTLINLYLRECAQTRKHLTWVKGESPKERAGAKREEFVG